MEPDEDLLKRAFDLLAVRYVSGTASPEEVSFYERLEHAPELSRNGSSPVAAPPRGRDAVPERIAGRVELPPPGRRADAVLQSEYRLIGNTLRWAKGEWIELVPDRRVPDHFLHNWVSKLHGQVGAFRPGHFHAMVRKGRLFARFRG